MPRCEALTKKKDRCPFLTEMASDGRFLCHIHHPNMVYQLQVEAKRLAKAGKKKKRVERTREYFEYLAALRAKMGLSEPARRR